MIAPSAKDRRTIAVGCVAIGSIVALGQGIPWWTDWDADQRARAALVLNRAAEFERASGTLVVMADSARRKALQYKAATEALLVEETPTIAGAKLTQLVAEVGDDARLRITSLQVRPDTAFTDRFARVAVRLTAIGDIRALVTLLENLDEQDTMLAVKEMSVVPAEPSAPGTKPEALHIQLLVEALALKPAPVILVTHPVR